MVDVFCEGQILKRMVWVTELNHEGIHAYQVYVLIELIQHVWEKF